MKHTEVSAGIDIGWFALGVMTLVISHVTNNYRTSLIGLFIVWAFYKIIVDFIEAVAFLRKLNKPPEPPPPPPRRGSMYPPNSW